MSRSVVAAASLFGAAVLLASSASLAGETRVHVSVTTPADVAAAEEGAVAEVAPPPQVTGGIAQHAAQLAVRTADTLGPSYKVTSMQFSMGQHAVGTVETFETKPARRKVLRDGPIASVDPRGDRLRVKAVVRGVGSGDFAWLNRYEYTVQGTCPVELSAGDLTQVDVVVVRKAPLLADFGEGLQIECRDNEG